MQKNVRCGLSRISNQPSVAWLESHMGSDVGQIFPTASTRACMH